MPAERIVGRPTGKDLRRLVRSAQRDLSRIGRTDLAIAYSGEVPTGDDILKIIKYAQKHLSDVGRIGVTVNDLDAGTSK